LGKKSYITEFDKSVMEKWLLKENIVTQGQFDIICKIENYLLAMGKTLYPLDIILEVSRFYKVSIRDMVGRKRRDEKARKARKVAIYMIDNEAAGLVNYVDIARIMGRGASSSTVANAIEYSTDCLRNKLDNLQNDIPNIYECLIKS